MNFFNDTRLITAMRLFLYNGSASIGTIIGVIAIVFLVGVQIATLFGVIDISSNVLRHSGVDFWVVTKNTENIDHDRQAALISLLPGFLSRLHYEFVKHEDPEAKEITGPGFRSFTRLAKDNPDLRWEIKR